MSDDARASHTSEDAAAPDPWAPPDSAGSPAPGAAPRLDKAGDAPGAHAWAPPAGTAPGRADEDAPGALIPGSSVPPAPQDTVIGLPPDTAAPTLPGGTAPADSVHDQATVAGMPPVPAPHFSATPPVPPPAPAPMPTPGPAVPPVAGYPAPPYAGAGGAGGGAGYGGHGGYVPPPPVGPEGPGQVPYGYPQYPGAAGGYGGPGYGPQAGPGAYPWGGMPLAPQNGVSTASLVLGIITVVIFCLWPVSILLGVLAVILGIVGRRRAGRGESTNPGQALAGIICGAVGALLGVALMLFIFLAPDDTDESPWPPDEGYNTTLTLPTPR
ncbi:hypothetical protein QFZ63_002583 [Streptomyces sp. B3I7]|uniref:DUF4190 domain-containing protein n=1 Tax=Streptomyces sp. B3I7 TaxID=3042269 RepID=UPI002782BFC4|nr:DUF4190 domain-containing protein [Streptomyces sp. B3I7]MDQ0810869.1 hypothetical protein [Streptomyces sp. B3I7]